MLGIIPPPPFGSPAQAVTLLRSRCCVYTGENKDTSISSGTWPRSLLHSTTGSMAALPGNSPAVGVPPSQPAMFPSQPRLGAQRRCSDSPCPRPCTPPPGCPLLSTARSPPFCQHMLAPGPQLRQQGDKALFSPCTKAVHLQNNTRQLLAERKFWQFLHKMYLIL